MKKTLLEAANEMAAGLHEAGVIDADKMRECKLSHAPNAETQKVMEESDKGIGLTKCKDIEDLFRNLTD